MRFKVAAHTDVGIRKDTNQDSYCVLQAETENGDVLMATVCDGLGGLESGELASATIVKAFAKWFEEELPLLLPLPTVLQDARYQWIRMIKSQNQTIGEYGRQRRIHLGSTISVILLLEDGRYLIGQVGDSRVYKVTDSELMVLTADQTVVANEVRQGRLTPQQAERDPRRNVLLQCVGASRVVEPEFVSGTAEPGQCYMLCSDGFRHELSTDELHRAFAPAANTAQDIMQQHLVRLVEENMARGETDNITAVLVRTC